MKHDPSETMLDVVNVVKACQGKKSLIIYICLPKKSLVFWNCSSFWYEYQQLVSQSHLRRIVILGLSGAVVEHGEAQLWFGEWQADEVVGTAVTCC